MDDGNNRGPEPRFERGRHLILVGGCPRSGTTLVQNVLDSHPRIAGGPQFRSIRDIVKLRNLLRQKVRQGWISTFLTEDEVDVKVGAFVESLLHPYMHQKDAVLLAEKTPSNALWFVDLLTILPEARFIYCLRDPRAVTNSMLEVGPRAHAADVWATPYTRKVTHAITTIAQYHASGFAAARISDRVMIVRYEELVDDPSRVTRSVCDFLGVEWSERMTIPGTFPHDGEAQIDGVWQLDTMFTSNPTIARVDAWRRSLSRRRQVAISTAFAADQDLRRQGYDLMGEVPFLFRFLRLPELAPLVVGQLGRVHRLRRSLTELAPATRARRKVQGATSTKANLNR